MGSGASKKDKKENKEKYVTENPDNENEYLARYYDESKSKSKKKKKKDKTSKKAPASGVTSDPEEEVSNSKKKKKKKKNKKDEMKISAPITEKRSDNAGEKTTQKSKKKTGQRESPLMDITRQRVDNQYSGEDTLNRNNPIRLAESQKKIIDEKTLSKYIQRESAQSMESEYESPRESQIRDIPDESVYTSIPESLPSAPPKPKPRVAVKPTIKKTVSNEDVDEDDYDDVTFPPNQPVRPPSKTDSLEGATRGPLPPLPSRRDQDEHPISQKNTHKIQKQHHEDKFKQERRSAPRRRPPPVPEENIATDVDDYEKPKPTVPKKEPKPKKEKSSTEPQQPRKQPAPLPTDKIESANEVERADHQDENEYTDAASAPAESTPGIKVVVAIDFGTTFSGYAYSHTSSKHDVKMNPNWTVGAASSYKTPTCVVIDDSTGEVEAFGFEAFELYFQEDKDPNLSYYQEFKLDLMKKGLSESTEISGDYGRPIRALDLFAKVLKFIKDKIVGNFSNQGLMNDIRWVLTVPAIWEDTQKLFMRKAAKQAGLIGNVDSTNLLIALEPEAASLYCRSLKMNCFKNYDGQQALSLKKDTIYIVVDAGGGTIDITVHKVLESGKVAEIHRARGGPWGGSKVNGKFDVQLQSILGEDFVQHCKKEFPVIWLQLMREFEQAKQSEAAVPDSNKSMTVRVGFGLSDRYQEYTGERITTAFQKKSDTGVKMTKGGNIDLSRDIIQSLFHPVTMKTTNLLMTLFEETKIAPATDVFIVGGFGQCPYLQEEIKKVVERSSRRVLIPEEGNLCVLRGAVMFGHQSDFITERVAKNTYAYLTTRPYDDSIDTEREPTQSSNGELVVDYLEPIIKKNDHVTSNEEIIKEFQVEDEEFVLDLYSSEEREVDDPNSDAVTKQGSLKISLPSSRRQSELGEGETVRVTFTLGTELKVKGIHMASNTSTETSMRLLM